LVTVGDGSYLPRREDDFSIAEAAPTGEDVVMDAATLQFGVEKTKINWGTFFQDMMRSRWAASSQFETYSGRGPSVVVRNAKGEKRVLEVTKTVKEARDRTAIEQDFKRLNTAQWCERYDVPVSFESG
jgi:hypothetical protein